MTLRTGKRYEALRKRLHSFKGNRHGLYFERMVTGGRTGHENQLDDVLTAYTSREGVRRSVLQVGIFDPARDQIGSGPRGFPCLQQISFAPLDTGLSVNAFYAAQYAIGRAYGNYLGICRLGRFVAHELGIELARVTIYAGILQRDVAVGQLTGLASTIDQRLPTRQP